MFSKYEAVAATSLQYINSQVILHRCQVFRKGSC